MSEPHQYFGMDISNLDAVNEALIFFTFFEYPFSLYPAEVTTYHFQEPMEKEQIKSTPELLNRLLGFCKDERLVKRRILSLCAKNHYTPKPKHNSGLLFTHELTVRFSMGVWVEHKWILNLVKLFVFHDLPTEFVCGWIFCVTLVRNLDLSTLPTIKSYHEWLVHVFNKNPIFTEKIISTITTKAYWDRIVFTHEKVWATTTQINPLPYSEPNVEAVMFFTGDVLNSALITTNNIILFTNKHLPFHWCNNEPGSLLENSFKEESLKERLLETNHHLIKTTYYTPPDLESSDLITSFFSNMQFGLSLLIYNTPLLTAEEIVGHCVNDQDVVDQMFLTKNYESYRSHFGCARFSHFQPTYKKIVTKDTYGDALANLSAKGLDDIGAYSQRLSIDIFLPNTTILVSENGVMEPNQDKKINKSELPKSSKIMSGSELLLGCLRKEVVGKEFKQTPDFLGVGVAIEPTNRNRYEGKHPLVSRDVLWRFLRFLTDNYISLNWEVSGWLINSKDKLSRVLLYLIQLLYLPLRSTTELNMSLVREELLIFNNNLTYVYNSETGGLRQLHNEKPPMKDKVKWLTKIEVLSLLNKFILFSWSGLPANEMTSRIVSTFVTFFIQVLDHDDNIHQGEECVTNKFKTNKPNRILIDKWCSSLSTNQKQNSLMWLNPEYLSLVLSSFILSTGFERKVILLHYPSIPYNFFTMESLINKEEYLEDCSFWLFAFLKYPVGVLLDAQTKSKITAIYKPSDSKEFFDLQHVTLYLGGTPKQIFGDFNEKKSLIIRGLLLPTLNLGTFKYKHIATQDFLNLKTTQIQLLLSSSFWIFLLKL